ncbi:MAG TPA: DUF6226 family protein [Gemmatimonas sp.]|nr:DUF6226 family protein [Gemmatimonas sp.]
MRRFAEGAPLPSAYTTVTDGARFAPLHAAALALFGDLGSTFSCESLDSFTHDDARGPQTHARPPITLVPTGGGAPLAMAFIAPIGVMLTCGWWYSDVFPSCSCDACALTADSEAERLTELCRAVVAGRFQEALRTPLFGMAKQSHAFQTATGSRSGWSVLPRAEARRLRGARPSKSAWKPWELRVRTSTVGALG